MSDAPRAARSVLPGAFWPWRTHRTQAEVMAAEVIAAEGGAWMTAR